MRKYKLIIFILITLSIWFTGCGSSSNSNDNPESENSQIISLMADRNLSVSNIHSIYRGQTYQMKLMRTEGQNLYKNDIAFAFSMNCGANCENYAYRMYIDSDNNIESGYKINGIGSDIRIGSDGYYRWSHNAWIPDIQIYQYEYILDLTGSYQLVIVAHVGTNKLFKTETSVVVTAGLNMEDFIRTPVILVTDF